MKKKVKVNPTYGRKKGDNTVWARLYFPASQSQMFLSSGVKIAPEFWDKENKRIDTSMPGFIEAQEKIDKFFYEIEYVIKKLDYENREINRENILKALGKSNRYSDKKESVPVWRHLFQLIELSPISDSTKRVHRRTANLFKEFEPTLTFDKISSSTAVEWDEFLHSRYDNLNTIAGHHKVLLTYFNKAAIKKLMSYESLNEYKQFKRPRIKRSREALHPGELKAIENLDYEKFTILDNVKNLFLFGCYTGLRISDVTGLKKEHILNDEGRGIIIRKEIYKLRHLGRKIELPIETLFGGKALEIINYYKEEMAKSPYVLPQYSHPVINRYLKVITHHAGLNKDISFHYSRHTFLTILAMKVRDLFVVMDYGAITSVTTAQGYIHMAAKWQDEKIKNVDWNL